MVAEVVCLPLHLPHGKVQRPDPADSWGRHWLVRGCCGRGGGLVGALLSLLCGLPFFIAGTPVWLEDKGSCTPDVGRSSGRL